MFLKGTKKMSAKLQTNRLTEPEHGVSAAPTSAGKRVTSRASSELPTSDSDHYAALAEVRAALWNSLPFAQRDPGDLLDLQEVVAVYGRSLAALSKARQEISEFFRVLCQTTLEFRGEGSVSEAARARVLEAQLEQMVASCRLPPWPPDPVFTADICREPLADAIPRLREELAGRTRGLAGQIFEVCERLMTAEIVGRIAWKTASACQLHFHRRVIVQRQTKSEVAGRPSAQLSGPLEDAFNDEGLSLVVSRRRTEVTDWENEFRSARHEHHLVEAVREGVDQTKVPIPEPLRALVQAIPAWLRPSVNIVHGMQFRGTSIERVVHHETWQESRALAPLIEYVPMMEPALTIGHYVLVGWGVPEIVAEIKRQDDMAAMSKTDEPARTQRRRSAVQFVALAAVAILVLTVGALLKPPVIAVGLVVTGMALWPAFEVLRYDAALRQKALVVPLVVFGLTAAASITLGTASLILAGWTGASVHLVRACWAGVLGGFALWRALKART